MFDVLRTYFKSRTSFTEEELDYICGFFISRRLSKGEFLQREGDVSKYGAFVTKGFLRSYVIDARGKEHIIQFAPENWWLSDLNSLTTGVASPYFIDAIENTDVLLIDFPSHKKLMEDIPAFALSFHTGIQKQTSTKDARIISSLSTSAEKRYQHFLETYPSIAQRIPQHMLASYLGISPETLSRIRKQQATKK